MSMPSKPNDRASSISSLGRPERGSPTVLRLRYTKANSTSSECSGCDVHARFPSRQRRRPQTVHDQLKSMPHDRLFLKRVSPAARYSAFDSETGRVGKPVEVPWSLTHSAGVWSNLRHCWGTCLSLQRRLVQSPDCEKGTRKQGVRSQQIAAAGLFFGICRS